MQNAGTKYQYDASVTVNTKNEDVMEPVTSKALPNYQRRCLLVLAGLVSGLMVLETQRTSAIRFHVQKGEQKKYFSLSGHSSETNREASLPWSFPLSVRNQESSSSSPSYYYRNRSQMMYEFNSTVQFIFTVGLEGTGHHFVEIIAKKSPAVRRLKQLGIWDEMVGPLRKLLFADTAKVEHPVGLWNAHCLPNKNPSMLEEEIVEKLKNIEAQANSMVARDSQMSTTTERITFPLPLNTAPTISDGRYGEVSYPNFMGPCRLLKYPDLNLLYNACRKAQVDCLQVYIYRHPMEILQSIVRRNFGQEDTATMQLYIADLHVITNQLRMYAAKTIGCFNFLSDDPKDLFWIEAQRDLWAWEDVTQYQAFMKNIYHAPPQNQNSSTHQEKSFNIPLDSHYRPYFLSWLSVHEHAVQVCRKAALTGFVTW